MRKKTKQYPTQYNSNRTTKRINPPKTLQNPSKNKEIKIRIIHYAHKNPPLKQRIRKISRYRVLLMTWSRKMLNCFYPIRRMIQIMLRYLLRVLRSVYVFLMAINRIRHKYKETNEYENNYLNNFRNKCNYKQRKTKKRTNQNPNQRKVNQNNEKNQNQSPKPKLLTSPTNKIQQTKIYSK